MPANEENEILYIVGNSAEAGVWTGTCEKITEYYEGLTILYKVDIAGVSGGTTLNINDLGAVAVKRNASTAVTTIYPVGSVVMLTYSGGAWLTADYDANTKNTAGTSNKADTKMYLVGATSQTSSGATTYTNKNVYIDADNCLYSNGKKVAAADEVPTAEQFNLLSGTVDGKLAKNQGAANAGKILVVGSDGNLTLTDMPEPGVAGDVVGTLDENNNILLSGDIAEGTYPLKWKMTDGTYSDAGTLTVTLNPETPEPDVIINLIPISTNADGTPYVGTNGEKGYKVDSRLSGSSGDEKTQSGCCVTGFMKINDPDERIYIKNIALHATSGYNSIILYDADKTFILNQAFTGSTVVHENGGVYYTKPSGWTGGDRAVYFRFCCASITADSIATAGQEIE